MPEHEQAGAFVISIRDSERASRSVLARAQDGDFAAYERLYHRHVGRIYALCLRMTADPANAEDMTQQTFIRAWERLQTVRDEESFAAWLRRVAVNMVLTDRRSRGRRSEVPVGDAQAVKPTRPDPPNRDCEIDLERAIAQLPDRTREVFVLHDVEGYRHEEIAAMLDIVSGTSKSQLHRARRLLREALRP